MLKHDVLALVCYQLHVSISEKNSIFKCPRCACVCEMNFTCFCVWSEHYQSDAFYVLFIQHKLYLSSGRMLIPHIFLFIQHKLHLSSGRILIPHIFLLHKLTLTT